MLYSSNKMLKPHDLLEIPKLSWSMFCTNKLLLVRHSAEINSSVLCVNEELTHYQRLLCTVAGDAMAFIASIDQVNSHRDTLDAIHMKDQASPTPHPYSHFAKSHFVSKIHHISNTTTDLETVQAAMRCP